MKKSLKNLKSDIISNVNDLENLAQNFKEMICNAHAKSTKIIKVKTNITKEWFCPKLLKMRKNVRKQFRKCYKARKENSSQFDEINERFKKLRDEYKKECINKKSQSWKDKCSNLEDAKEISRLRKFLEKGKSAGVGGLLKEDESYTKSRKETHEYLFKTHFKDAIEIFELDLLYEENIENIVDDLNEEELENICSEAKINSVLDNLGDFKSPGEDGIFPCLLKKVKHLIIPTLKRMFIASLKNRVRLETLR